MGNFADYKFENMTNEELFSCDGGIGVVNVVSGVTALAGVVGTVFPPANIVTLAGACFLIGYGLAQ